MKLKLLVAALALAAASSSMAKTEDLGLLSDTPTSFSNEFLSFSPESFSDTYTFTLGASGSAYGGVTTSAFWFSGINLSSLTLSGNGLSTTLTDLSPGAFSFGSLLAGTYSMVLKGKSTGWAGYSGMIETTRVAAPVPEPETIAMMALGLGVMGFVARRRKQLGK